MASLPRFFPHESGAVPLLPPTPRPLDRSLPNGVTWLRGALLEVAGKRFRLEVNPPTVDKVRVGGLRGRSDYYDMPPLEPDVTWNACTHQKASC